MRSRLIAGIFSLLLVLLVIVGPVYLSEKLEVIETSRSGLIPFSEVVSESNTSTYYEPYYNLNNDTEGSMSISGTPYSNGVSYDAPDYAQSSINYDSDSWEDSYVSSQQFVTFFQFMIEIDPADMQLNDIDTIYLRTESFPSNYKVESFVFWAQNEDYTYYDLIVLKELEFTFSAGDRTSWYNLTTTNLNNMVTKQASGPASHCMISAKIIFASAMNFPSCVVDFQINPSYYERTLTTYENETITTYVPYIQSITPYSVHKVSMVAGGILILLVGLVASPLPIGEVFNGILPINNKKGRRSR